MDIVVFGLSWKVSPQLGNKGKHNIMLGDTTCARQVLMQNWEKQIKVLRSEALHK